MFGQLKGWGWGAFPGSRRTALSLELLSLSPVCEAAPNITLTQLCTQMSSGQALLCLVGMDWQARQARLGALIKNLHGCVCVRARVRDCVCVSGRQGRTVGS